MPKIRLPQFKTKDNAEVAGHSLPQELSLLPEQLKVIHLLLTPSNNWSIVQHKTMDAMVD